MTEQQTYDVRFRHPCTMMLCGSSKAGKTTWLHTCLRNMKDMFTPVPSHVVFYYSAWQDLYEEMKKEGLVSEWINACPQKEYIQELGEKHKADGGLLVLVDDMLSQMNKDMADLFHVVSHHSRTSICFLSQQIFVENSNFRSMRAVVNYLVLFKNPSNKAQAKTFFNQIEPDHSKALNEVFRKVTKTPYTYLLFDFHQETPDAIRFRTDIFPNDKNGGAVTIFVPPFS